ncbi:MAG: DUF6340 family protein [Dysgonamonadaceae bacterium]|nr:DUF6340 family protein [Dysgonamonadaceae bacterium]
MKKMKICLIRVTFFFPFILFVSSCAGTYQLSIEVQEPAAITLSPDIADLLIVNNSAKQPNSQGIVQTYNKKDIPDFALDLDSIVWHTIHSFSSHAHKAHFFKSLSYYKQPLREDEKWLVRTPLSLEFKRSIFDEQAFSGIFSIDRCLLKLDGQIRNNMLKQGSNTFYYADFRLELNLACSIYLYNREKPLTTFTVTDSLIYKDGVWSDSLFIFKELPETLMTELAYNMGEKLAYQIVPSWATKKRVLYVEQSSRMREAFAFTKTGQWNRAESLWLVEFDKKTKNRDKAKIANNIAVANEIQDRPEAALRWAEKAKEYAVNGSGEWLLFNDYAESLQKRIQDNHLLDIQWGKSDK